MKVVNKIDTEKQVNSLTEQERDDLFTKMVMGKDVTEEIETSRGKFTVKFPKAADTVSIGRIMAMRRDYRPVSAFDNSSEEINTIASTLDVIVVSGPDWFEDARKKNANFSFLEVPSRVFLAELYGKAYYFRNEVEKRLKEGGEPADKPVPAEEGADDAVDGGAFGGLSNQ
jgi:hypothetical protein